MRTDVTEHSGNGRVGDSAADGSDIAIVGMSGRFPGSADVAELWANMRAGKSGITRFTDEALRAAGVAQRLLDDPSYVRAGGVIDGIELFDAGFFGFRPMDAQIIDPQQRLYLEHSWHALEDSGWTRPGSTAPSGSSAAARGAHTSSTTSRRAGSTRRWAS
jgi:acyl transferase domain-containing protein